MRVWGMRTGISFILSPTDHARLSALVRDRNAPQKHVWRAEIVLSIVRRRQHRRDHAPDRQGRGCRLEPAQDHRFRGVLKSQTVAETEGVTVAGLLTSLNGE